MNTIQKNNIRISGKGERAIIFAHGFGCNQNMWRLVAPAFEESNQVVLFDHVGAGGSDLSAYDRIKYNSLQGYANDVVEICKSLDLTKSIFVGHSVSAMIGMLAAIKAPEYFEKLIMIGPSPSYINDGLYKGGFERQGIAELLNSMESNFEDWSKNLAPVIMGNPDQPNLSAELVQSFCVTKPDIIKQFAQVTFQSDNRLDLSKLRIPSLILQCAEDAIAPLAVGRYLEEHLQDSKLIQLKATGHCPHLSAPQETIQAIRDYLLG